MGILKTRHDYSTSSDLINILAALPSVPDQDCYIHDKYAYIGKIDDLDTHSVYKIEINKVAMN